MHSPMIGQSTISPAKAARTSNSRFMEDGLEA
jgi:hypothetical protein